MYRLLIRASCVVAGTLLSLGGAASVVTQFGHFAMHTYRIPSPTMEPTLHCARPADGCEGDTSDWILVPRFAPFWAPSRGEIVVFRTPPAVSDVCGEDGTFVKRVIGLSGETISERHGRIYVDGTRLKEPYVEHPGTGSGTWHVPKGGYFVLGDNRRRSCDSRYWGALTRHDLIGPMVASRWPL